jgi:hypothetical protein
MMHDSMTLKLAQDLYVLQRVPVKIGQNHQPPKVMSSSENGPSWLVHPLLLTYGHLRKSLSCPK